jgi:hypothetical protein
MYQDARLGERQGTRSGTEADFAVDEMVQLNAINSSIPNFARKQARTESGFCFNW